MLVVDVFPTPVMFAQLDRATRFVGTNCRHRLFLGEDVLV